MHGKQFNIFQDNLLVHLWLGAVTLQCVYSGITLLTERESLEFLLTLKIRDLTEHRNRRSSFQLGMMVYAVIPEFRMLE